MSTQPLPLTLPWDLPRLPAPDTARRAHAVSPSERLWAPTPTMLGAVLPVAYGQTTLPGYLVAAEREGSSIVLVWAVGYGEVTALSAADVSLNGQQIDQVPGFIAWDSRAGTTSQAVIGLLSAIRSQFVEAYPGVVLVAVQLDQRKFDPGSSLDLRVQVSGRKITDPRTSTVLASTNPVVIAYDVLTALEPWGGIVAASAIDTASLTTAADWCDDVMGDSSARYSVRGAIHQRDPWRAAELVLRSAHVSLVEYGGTIYFAAERDADTTAGTIETGDWVTPPTIDEADPDRPTALRVTYLDADGVTRRHVLVGSDSDPDARVGDAALDLAAGATVAYRWGAQYLREVALPYVLRGVVSPAVAADLLPGDVLTVSTPQGLTDHEARVAELSERADGRYEITLRSRVVGTEGTETQGEDSTPSQRTGAAWTPGTPAAPTGLTATATAVGIASYQTAMALSVSWDQPDDTPPVDHYEIWLGSRLLGVSPGTSWSGITQVTGTALSLSVYAVGYDGSKSTPASIVKTVSGGKNSNLVGKNVEDLPTSATDSPVYDPATDTYKNMRPPDITTITTGYSIPSGGISKTVFFTNAFPHAAVAFVDDYSNYDPVADQLSCNVGTDSVTVYRAQAASHALPIGIVIWRTPEITLMRS